MPGLIAIGHLYAAVVALIINIYVLRLRDMGATE